MSVGTKHSSSSSQTNDCPSVMLSKLILPNILIDGINLLSTYMVPILSDFITNPIHNCIYFLFCLDVDIVPSVLNHNKSLSFKVLVSILDNTPFNISMPYSSGLISDSTTPKQNSLFSYKILDAIFKQTMEFIELA